MSAGLTRRTFGGVLASATLAPKGAFAAADVEAARREGALLWYTTLVVDQVVRPLIQGFSQKYPGIKVSFVPGPAQEQTLRITSEARAGQPRGDVVDGAFSFFPLNAAGLIAPYSVESAAQYPTVYKDPAGLWTAHFLGAAVAAVNTDMVRAEEIPQTYDDLLHPRWRGRIAWPDTPTLYGGAGVVGNILTFMGRDKGMEFIEKLAKQQIINVPSNQRVVLDQCIAGQYPLVLSVFNHHAAFSASRGAPIKWLKLEPVLVSFSTISLIKNAPHPNAAKLFLEYNMSEEGQTIYGASGYVPVHSKAASQFPGLRPEDGNFKATIITPANFNANQKDWVDIYKRLFA